MPKQYIGHLPSHDPLHPYLVHDVLPQIGVRNSTAEFRVFSMKDTKVYLYEERHSCAQGFDLLVGPSPSGNVSFERKENTSSRC